MATQKRVEQTRQGTPPAVGWAAALSFLPAPHRLPAEERLLPPEAFGVRCMSMGLLMAEDSAAVWRGPMVMSALQTFMDRVAWAPLDVLLLDMPPGTGDAQLTVSQRLALSGAVIVSTPQVGAWVECGSTHGPGRSVGLHADRAAGGG